MQGLFVFAAVCLAAVVAVPRVRHEDRWHPSPPRDISQYRPRGDMFPMDAATAAAMPKQTPRQRSPITKSIYNLAEECGVEGPPAENKIVGGDEAAPHQYPWIVALFIDNAWFCGGSLISEKWVLTAAHCVDGAHRFEVMAGAHNVRASSEPHRVSIVSSHGFTHEHWDRYKLKNDIALIELPEAVTFSDYIKPSCLPAAGNAVSEGDLLSVIGWGKPSDHASSISPVLRMVHNLPTMTNKKCNSFYGIVGDGVVCVDTTGGHSSCNGDSGGPLMVPQSSVKEAGQKWDQVGIVSFGSSAGCEKGYPAAFTRTEYYREWIETNSGV